MTNTGLHEESGSSQLIGTWITESQTGMSEKTQENVYAAFVGEAKAHHRLLAFARKAEAEGYRQVAKLFRAVAAAEGVHAERHLRLLGEAYVRSTEENLQYSFEQETTVNQVTYPQFIREAEEEEEPAAAVTFKQARDVEERHAALYKRALTAMLREETHDYYVCQVCGYVAERESLEQCPVCNARRERFRRVT
jgi:rubrerythrin